MYIHIYTNIYIYVYVGPTGPLWGQIVTTPRHSRARITVGTGPDQTLNGAQGVGPKSESRIIAGGGSLQVAVGR